MLDFIYTLLIAPLEYWMHAALVWGYSHTEAWGPAIVVMSLAVNIVILPIYIKAEKWQEGERALRKSFEAKEAMIKRTFKGQERFAMISTMHRQAGYSPFCRCARRWAFSCRFRSSLRRTTSCRILNRWQASLSWALQTCPSPTP